MDLLVEYQEKKQREDKKSHIFAVEIVMQEKFDTRKFTH